jgi:DNA-binding response OmpR family regulator
MPLKFEKISILVVEDTVPMRKLLVSILESLGIGRIYTADQGEKGYEVFQANNPDIIIADWLMKPVDGIEMIKKIRTHHGSPNKLVPVIMVTGYNALGRVKEARDMGVTEFLIKPFTASDLAKRIAYVVNRPRDFIDTGEYFGPDRRRKLDSEYKGPYRRDADGDKIDSPGRSTWEVG